MRTFMIGIVGTVAAAMITCVFVAKSVSAAEAVGNEEGEVDVAFESTVAMQVSKR
jgi:hypothetical protein